MEALRKEIENKKRLLKEAQAVSEVEQILENKTSDPEKYHETMKNDINGDKNRDIRGLEPSTNKPTIDETELLNIPSRKEVVSMLRERNQPIRLFGETDYQSYQRLKRIELIQPDAEKGFRNDFQQVLEKIDQQNALVDTNLLANNNLDSGLSGTNSKSFLDPAGLTQKARLAALSDVKIAEDTTTIDDILRLTKELGKGDYDLECSIILKYLKFIIKCWGWDLNGRPSAEKLTMKGRLESATYTQTRNYLKPLMARLKARTLQTDILESMTEIVKFALAREYIKANEAYMQMAIGNAPWPIGVTMPGIHVRTGRERIASRHVAHVLNDETQRKFVQGLKRILTANQKLFPTDPSKCA